jgi:hypothetical protein
MNVNVKKIVIVLFGLMSVGAIGGVMLAGYMILVGEPADSGFPKPVTYSQNTPTPNAE